MTGLKTGYEKICDLIEMRRHDVGGHIQACRHGGTCHRFNLFPQNANFNNSAYKIWENEITRAMQNGDDSGMVIVRFDRTNPF